MRILSLWEKV